jgi:hypothetical protein
MIFFYQALLDGWTIKMIDTKKFEMKRNETTKTTNVT